MWRIRITLSDDPRSLALFTEALADQPVSLVRMTPRGTDTAEITGEVVVELAEDEGLGTMLGALHTISPQVFVSRADPPESAAAQLQLDDIPRQPPPPGQLPQRQSPPPSQLGQRAQWREAAGRHLSLVNLVQ
jgi:hypothetical protein